MNTTGKHRHIAKIVALTAAAGVIPPNYPPEPLRSSPSRRILTLPTKATRKKAAHRQNDGRQRRSEGRQRNPGRGRHR